MAKIHKKPIGSPHETADPEWRDVYEELASLAIDLTVRPNRLARQLEKLAAEGDPMAMMVMKRLSQYGVSERWMNDIDSNVRNICVFAQPRIDINSRRFKWVYGFDVKPIGWIDYPAIFQSSYEVFCFVLMRLVDAGIEKVERCKAPAPKIPNVESHEKCGKYFFSRSNRKWCSTTCQVRVSSRGLSK